MVKLVNILEFISLLWLLQTESISINRESGYCFFSISVRYFVVCPVKQGNLHDMCEKNVFLAKTNTVVNKHHFQDVFDDKNLQTWEPN